MNNIDDWLEGDYDVFMHSMSETLRKRQGAMDAINEYVDSAGQSWFDLGANIERQNTLKALDNFYENLLESEEDARMTIRIIKEMILSAKLAGQEEEQE